MVRRAGAKKVYLASASPPVQFPNVYGVDMPSRKEFVANGLTIDQVRHLGSRAVQELAGAWCSREWQLRCSGRGSRVAAAPPSAAGKACAASQAAPSLLVSRWTGRSLYQVLRGWLTRVLCVSRGGSQVCQVLRADGLIYQEVDDLIVAGKELNPDIKDFDASCFTGW
jgi:hypothetical protein